MLTFKAAKVQKSLWSMYKLIQPFWKRTAKVLAMFKLSNPVIPLLGIYSKEIWKTQPRSVWKGVRCKLNDQEGISWVHQGISMHR